MKVKHPSPGFELSSLVLFSMTMTVIPCAPYFECVLFHILSDMFKMLAIKICGFLV